MLSKKNKQKVLIISGEWGHLSLAEALLEIFANHQGIHNVKLIKPNLKAGASFYNLFYLYFPSLFRFPFQASQIINCRKFVCQLGLIL
ncbi:MAG: hypothetical protein ACPLXP_01485 [Microgenomates group bacterium]